jgi:hypothetical protein
MQFTTMIATKCFAADFGNLNIVEVMNVLQELIVLVEDFKEVDGLSKTKIVTHVFVSAVASELGFLSQDQRDSLVKELEKILPPIIYSMVVVSKKIHVYISTKTMQCIGKNKCLRSVCN